MKLLLSFILAIPFSCAISQVTIDGNDVRNVIEFDRMYLNMQVVSDTGWIVFNGDYAFVRFGSVYQAYPLEKEYKYNSGYHNVRAKYTNERGMESHYLIEVHNSSHITIRFYSDGGEIDFFKSEIEDELNLKTYNDLTAAEKADIRRNQIIDCPYCNW